MPCHYRRDSHFSLLCTLCGREIAPESEYWTCNGNCICPGCLADFARQELAACHQIHGKEFCL
jgi:hypothetical protein